LLLKPVFAGESVVEVCGHHLHTAPMPPSERLESLPGVPEWTQAAALERWERRTARCELPEAGAGTATVDKGGAEPVSSRGASRPEGR